MSLIVSGYKRELESPLTTCYLTNMFKYIKTSLYSHEGDIPTTKGRIHGWTVRSSLFSNPPQQKSETFSVDIKYQDPVTA